jgi:rare lipoprotein A
LRSKSKLRWMRSVHVVIAGILLVVPGSALALKSTDSTAAGSVGSSPATALPARVTPRHVSLGDAIEVSGDAPTVAGGGQVVLQARYGRQAIWRRLSTTVVSPRGTFAFRAHPRHSALVRVLPATAQSAPGDPSAAARVTAVKVSAQLRTSRRERDVLAGQAVRVAGRLLPGRAGRTVALQGHWHTGWRTLARARTQRSGGFAVRYTTAATGIGRRLRVLFTGDRVNARSVKSAGAMTVYEQSVASWYQDGGSTACGFHAGFGVASRTLPCGAKVRFRHAGRTVTATVDDRGPYVGGRDWDLNQNTAAALGFDGVGTVWAAS